MQSQTLAIQFGGYWRSVIPKWCMHTMEGHVWIATDHCKQLQCLGSDLWLYVQFSPLKQSEKMYRSCVPAPVFSMRTNLKF